MGRQVMNNDKDLSASDIQVLSSRDGVVSFFASLGYNTDTRLPQTPAAMGITAESLQRQIKHIERVAVQDDGAEPLDVYLIELASVTVAATQGLARALRNRAGNYLLTLTDDYERLDFVLLERSLPTSPATPMATRHVSVRPRILTVNRRNPSSVQLRVLRRFTYTEADSDGQYDKLLSAYAVADWSEPLFNNRALFSDYYLNERLPERPEWQERPETAYHKLRELLSSARQRLAGERSEITRRNLLEPSFEALGFRALPATAVDDTTQPHYRMYTAEDSDNPLAVCLAYTWNRNLDGRDETRDSETADENPGARVVSLLDSGESQWAIVTNGKLWRLYSAKAHSRATNYYEIDLEETLAMADPNEAFRYFWLLFRSSAFVPQDAIRDGQTRSLSFLEELVEESESYAKALGERLKQRVFEEIFPHFAEGFIEYLRSQPPMTGAHQAALLPVVQQLALKQEPDEAFRRQVFQGTLTFLYRLLFLLYSESRGLLPVKEVRGYWEHSLSGMKEELASKAGNILDDAPVNLRKAYTAGSTSLYDRLFELFAVVDQGSRDLNVPLYNGGLFLSNPDSDDHSAEAENARFLKQHKIPDRYLALGLDRLARDIDDKRQSLVFIDYKSMGVRQLGSIYEGLLEFKVRVAPEKMAVIKGKKTEEVIPYQEAVKTKQRILTKGRGHNAEERVYKSGDVYLENDRRERKATGSYYTPDYIVKYIVEHTVGPVLDEKFEGLRSGFREAQRIYRDALRRDEAFRKQGMPAGNAAKVAINQSQLVDQLFDLRVLDPAMGSGHFLVEAVDFICDRIIGQRDGFLQAFPWNPVTAFLEDTRRAILTEMDRQGVSVDAGRLTDINLLKRHVLKRCVYGVDLNPMAVELAKVSLWLDCFTLGAPLSFLDHHLKCGNSLIGTTVQDVQAELATKEEQTISMFGGPFQGLLSGTATMLELARTPDVTVAEAEKSRGLFASFENTMAPYKRALDIWASRDFGNALAQEYLTLVGRDFVEEIRSGGAKLSQRYRDVISNAGDLGQEKRFFHWDLEFPEAFVDLGKSTWKSIEEQGFDAVIGNPPYNVELDKDERSYWRKRFNISPQPMNLAGIFYVSALRALSMKQIVGMIIPKSITFSRGWEPVVEAVLPHLDKLIDASKAFEDVLLEQVVAICCARAKLSYDSGVFSNGEVTKAIEQQKSVINTTKVLVTGLDSKEAELGEKLLLSGRMFGEVTQTFRGLPWQRYLTESGHEPVLGGKSLQRYGIRPNARMVGNLPEDAKRNIQRLRQPKILSQNIVAHVANPQPHIRIIAALDADGILNLDTVNNTISTSPSWPLEVLLALLNSNLYSWYMYRLVYNQAIRTMHFDESYVGRLPLPELTDRQREDAIKLVEDARECRSNAFPDGFRKVDKLLDAWAYEAFCLTDQEVAYIDSTTFHGDS